MQQLLCKMNSNHLLIIVFVCIVSKYYTSLIVTNHTRIKMLANDWITKYTGKSKKTQFYNHFSQTKRSYMPMHIWDKVKATCASEGALVYYPESEAEFLTIIDFWKLSINNIFLGMERTSSGLKTLDGRPVSTVYNVWRQNEPNNVGGNENCVHAYFEKTWGLNDVSCLESVKLPFICKYVEQHPKCNIPSHLYYTYTEQLGKCYKFHLTPKTWSEARDVCRAEHSDLAVINSREEAEYLASLTRAIHRTRIPGTFLRGAVHLGFHKVAEDWQTIEETSLYDSGYACWGNSQPDNEEHDKCGSMFYNGHLNDIGCDMKAFFICEHNVPDYAYEPPSAIKSLECYDDIQMRLISNQEKVIEINATMITTTETVSNGSSSAIEEVTYLVPTY